MSKIKEQIKNKINCLKDAFFHVIHDSEDSPFKNMTGYWFVKAQMVTSIGLLVGAMTPAIGLAAGTVGGAAIGATACVFAKPKVRDYIFCAIVIAGIVFCLRASINYRTQTDLIRNSQYRGI